jgi:hypothetical protein
MDLVTLKVGAENNVGVHKGRVHTGMGVCCCTHLGHPHYGCVFINGKTFGRVDGKGPTDTGEGQRPVVEDDLVSRDVKPATILSYRKEGNFRDLPQAKVAGEGNFGTGNDGGG